MSAQTSPGDEACASAEALIVRASSHPEESARLRLSDCEGRPRTQALARLSRLARPHGIPPEGDPSAAPRPGLTYVAPGIPRLDPGLLTRLATLARRWPDRRILIVSGVRPRARRSSRHRVARALDVIVEGVERRRVSEFARGLAATGVGYYPNSTFTHVDVRARAAYWIDLSGPGERARYVRPAPEAAPHVATAAPPPTDVAPDPT
ncbi:MAG: DUF882 domain-containing protein, partial [Deltaproteobacteria bacterium]|nr:DUF882 domain-containing protein [Deltaproteobacteria bacterium]